MATRVSRRKISGYIAEQLVAGASPEPLVRQLAALLIETGRTGEVGLIVRDIEYELAQRGIVMATLTSAFDLDAATTAAVTALITAQTDATQVKLRSVIDQGVLGGVKIDLPGRQLDSTIARRLTTLRTNFKK